MKIRLNNNTNGPKKLSSFSVPDELRVRLPIGLDFFENVLCGQGDSADPFGTGFVPSTSMMLTGTPGAGKTTLLLQVANALAGNGHTVLYNTGEESLFQVKMTAERLGLRNDFYVDSETNLPQLIKTMKSLMKNFNPVKTRKGFFLLQDSIQTLDDGKYSNGHTNSNTPVRCTEELTSFAKETFGNIIFIGQVNKDGEFNGKNTMLHAVDSRLHLYVDKNKKSETFGQRILEPLKNRFGSGEAQVLSMTRKGLTGLGSVDEFQFAA